MSASTLDPDNFPAGRNARTLPPGHDIGTLGPSDSSDSGSDMAGPGLLSSEDDLLDLDRGTNEDLETGRYDEISGAGVGDLDLEDNSDRVGTGEHKTAGREPRTHSGGDIDVDQVVSGKQAGLGGGLDQAEEAQLGMTDEELDAAARDGDPEGAPRRRGKA